MSATRAKTLANTKLHLLRRFISGIPSLPRVQVAMSSMILPLQRVFGFLLEQGVIG